MATLIDWIQTNSAFVLAIATVVLVLVTIFYAKRTSDIAKSTKAQADASVRMAEEMSRSSSPFVTLTWIGFNPNDKTVRVSVKNEGMGPALNLVFYLTHEGLFFKKKLKVYTTFSVGQEYPLTLPCEEFDMKTGSGLSIICDYADFRGRRLRSTLKDCELQENRLLEIIELDSGVGND